MGATADRATLDSYGERLITRWSDPSRIHHNLKRLIGVLARVDELAPETHNPDVVRIAAWYHGAAFDAAARQAYAHRGGVDEVASSELARTELTELGVPEDIVERVSMLIIGIARHSAPKDDIDAQALCDADLGGLAAEPQRYQAYRREVREEYQHIPDRDYVEARLAIVTKLLNRNRLFKSPMAQPWEDAARENLAAELDRLTAKLEKLPPRDESTPHGETDDPSPAQPEAFENEPPPEDTPRSETDSTPSERDPAAERGTDQGNQAPPHTEHAPDEEPRESRDRGRDIPSLSRPPKMPSIKHHPVTRRH
ncbi:hypothetical protein [Ruania alba]|uniref:hypothetical protein n=1 Tax=Ruania alba TaxID=648782 RepID=UPI001587BC34|nr:hypothetical protein [Ruania alba]